METVAALRVLAGGTVTTARLPGLGHALAMRADPLRLLVELAREHGGIAPVQLGPLHGYLITEPACLQEIFVTHPDRYSRLTQVYEAMSEFLGFSILTTEGEDWKKHRRIVQPAFHHKRLASFAGAMTRITREHIDSWSGEIDVSAAMMRLTLQIVSDTLLGTKTQDHVEAIGRSIEHAQRYTEAVMARPLLLPPSVPTPRRLAFRETLATLDRIAYQLIDEHGEGDGGDTSDAVSMLLAARYEDGSPLPRRRIRDELLTLLAAGHETTSNALSWTLMRLSQHPGVARKLQAEVDEVLGGREPTIDDVKRLPYARRVLDESMRLHPPAWATGRLVKEAHTLGGVAMKPGKVMFISPYVTQRRPDLWDNAEGFDPDRWVALSERGALAPFTFFPFGGGRRKCVGEAFAYLEATLILAMIAQRYELHLSGRPVEPTPQITLGLASGLWMQVVPRAPRGEGESRGDAAPRSVRARA